MHEVYNVGFVVGGYEQFPNGNIDAYLAKVDALGVLVGVDELSHGSTRALLSQPRPNPSSGVVSSVPRRCQCPWGPRAPACRPFPLPSDPRRTRAGSREKAAG